MSYYCDTCDKSIKMKSKKKHLVSKSHKCLYYSIVTKYRIKNPEFFKIEDILNKHIDDYQKNFEYFVIICEWKLVFDNNNIFCEKTKEYYNICPIQNLKVFLREKINYFEHDYKFSHISEMKITFITNLRCMTYQNYIRQPKSMLEWTLIKKLSTNPELIKNLNRTPHPLIRKYKKLFYGEEDNPPNPCRIDGDYLDLI